jgi:hypothetical protein
MIEGDAGLSDPQILNFQNVYLRKNSQWAGQGQGWTLGGGVTVVAAGAKALGPGTSGHWWSSGHKGLTLGCLGSRLPVFQRLSPTFFFFCFFFFCHFRRS